MSNILPMEPSLDRRAERIRKLMGDMVHNTLAIGAELEHARDSFPLGPKGQRMGYRTWLKDDVRMSYGHAAVLIAINIKFGHLIEAGQTLPAARVLQLLLPAPKGAQKEALRRAKRGEKVDTETAKKIVRKHLPSPKKANQIARDTGKPTAASDGYVYLGATDTEVKESTQRRTVVYAVREAVETIASIEISAAQFLEYALPHQLWKAKDQHQIAAASHWLQALSRAWEKRK